MEDIAAKLSEILNSPDGIEKIKSAAAGLFGGDEESRDTSKNEAESSPLGLDIPSLLGGNMPDLGSIQNIVRIMSLIKSRGEDKRISLLLALKPHLSRERAPRVDKAISLLKIASLLPILREEGVLDLLG